ncbi:uncharacterized protein RMCC_1371 [Mycolicibacterium canariasense]|uniref:Uncharacterized protein n=1 Tax=Mycolicibacterium canariasense TaxID=228230 RepID=A0A100WA94_MYCCR|nr:hypothetical protein [Mycolicibacterium canariasense]MCV7208807.1 hypothetical protein [Mycolicibacterium canariasense]ORV07128.1 hypothetical protein AWB94_14090 [Mycolicibacterium canariasense]GAS94405.1 uncharacterized protein RMCC_1371 [Mycolicibacterium canariasense]
MTERTRCRYLCRSLSDDGRELYNWACVTPTQVRIHSVPVDEFWPKPKPIPAEAIYLGSITLVERDGLYYAEHRNADGELTHTEDIGHRLALNFRMLGIDPPTHGSTERVSNTQEVGKGGGQK